MTRKHMVEAAKLLADCYRQHSDQAGRIHFVYIINVFCRLFIRYNANFDEARFRKAIQEDISDS